MHSQIIPFQAIFNLGPSEILLIFAIVLILFGPKKLPELGRSIGKGIRNFKKGLNEIETSAEEVDVSEDKKDKDDVKELDENSDHSSHKHTQGHHEKKS